MGLDSALIAHSLNSKAYLIDVVLKTTRSHWSCVYIRASSTINANYLKHGGNIFCFFNMVPCYYGISPDAVGPTNSTGKILLLKYISVDMVRQCDPANFRYITERGLA